jgi:hypothetical protein
LARLPRRNAGFLNHANQIAFRYANGTSELVIGHFSQQNPSTPRGFFVSRSRSSLFHGQKSFLHQTPPKNRASQRSIANNQRQKSSGKEKLLEGNSLVAKTLRVKALRTVKKEKRKRSGKEGKSESVFPPPVL